MEGFQVQYTQPEDTEKGREAGFFFPEFEKMPA